MRKTFKRFAYIVGDAIALAAMILVIIGFVVFLQFLTGGV